MSVSLYVLLGAVFRIGAAAVFIDPWIGGAGIEGAARLTSPSCFVGVRRAHLLRLRHPALRAIPRAIATGHGAWLMPRTRSFDSVLAAGRRSGVDAGIAAVAPEDHALVTFTSGSTGTPKGADRNHAFLLAQD